MRKTISTLIVLISAFAAHSGEPYVVSNNDQVLGVVYRDDGAGFVKLNIESSRCNNGWVWVPDSKVMALFLTARSTGMNLMTVVIDEAMGATYYVPYHTSTDCKIISVSL